MEKNNNNTWAESEESGHLVGPKDLVKWAKAQLNKLTLDFRGPRSMKIMNYMAKLSPITVWSTSLAGPPATITAGKPTVAFTTPANYAGRLSTLLSLKGFNPLWCPTLTVQCTPTTIAALKRHLSPQTLDDLSAVAFTSRTGISAVSGAISGLEAPILPSSGEVFTIAALGKDSELIGEDLIAKFCRNRGRIRVLVPPEATPSGIVKSLGDGGGRKVLCPVPVVVDVEEPPVVPNFLGELESNRWVPVRVDAYETRWAGPDCAKGVAEKMEDGELEGFVFTSTAEVEGLLKSLRRFGLDWAAVKRRFPGLIVAAHGPITAAGAERLGVAVDLVSAKFDSFDGVVNALYQRLHGLEQ